MQDKIFEFKSLEEGYGEVERKYVLDKATEQYLAEEYPHGNIEDAYYRIRAVKDFYDIEGKFIKAGTLGGLVHDEHSLAHYGKCWIDYSSVVLNYGKVMGNSLIDNLSVIGSGTSVKGDSIMKNVALSGDVMLVDCNIALQHHVELNFGYGHMNIYNNVEMVPNHLNKNYIKTLGGK